MSVPVSPAITPQFEKDNLSSLLGRLVGLGLAVTCYRLSAIMSIGSDPRKELKLERGVKTTGIGIAAGHWSTPGVQQLE